MLKQNLRTSRQVYFQIAQHHNPRIDPERHPKMFLLSTMNLNSVKLQRFVQSEVFVTNVTFNQCPLCVSKFKIKSDLKIHIKTIHDQLSFMLCFNVDLKTDLILNLETHRGHWSN